MGSCWHRQPSRPWTGHINRRGLRIVQINEGGAFGDKLRDVMEQTKDVQYPGHPHKGIMNWWEASIGTNPHIHRPRKDFPAGL